MNKNNRSAKSIKVRFRDIPKQWKIYFPLNITIRDSTRKYRQRNLEKLLNIIKFQNIEGKLYVYSTSLTTSYFVCKHQN